MLTVLAVVTVGGFSGLSADAGEEAMSFLGLDEMGPLQGISFAVLPAMVGMAAYSLNPNLESPDMAFPYLATEVFPLALGAFLLVAGLSATMSSGDSDAVTAVTILLRDVVHMVTGRMPKKEKMVLYSRVGLSGVLALALAGALVADTAIGYITTMISTILTGLFVASVLVSLVTPLARVSDEEALAQLAAERAQIDVGTTVKGAEA